MEKILNKSELIANELLNRIRSGELTGQLPSDKKVAEDFGVALMTATKALSLLQKRGAAVRIPRKGTFVLAERRKELKLCCHPRFFEIFKEYLALHHPEFDPVRVEYGDEKYDMIVMTTYPWPTGYETLATPFSRIRAERLRKSGRIWPELLTLHSKNNCLYGVPYLFSPILLHYNRTIMRRLDPDFDATELTLESFLQLLRKAAAEGFGGIDAVCHLPSFFLNAVCCCGGHSPAEEHLIAAAEILKKMCCASRGEFSSGRVLFALSPRHASYAPASLDIDIAPIPFINGRRMCPLASETLFVSSAADDPENLHELCEETLSPEFQRLIAADQYGLAADKSIAVDSMRTTRKRDDFFFSEIANIVITHKDYSMSTLQDICLAVNDFEQGGTAFPEFVRALREAFARQRSEEKRRRRFLEMQMNEYGRMDFSA